ncbi:MAG: DUF433 domain-containing protein [Spirochaetes bacterium]|nr:DUF433 domain-containing protein [Spirochaetota bacterium]
MYNYITYDPQILGGKPYIKDSRLSVEFIMELLASGGSIKEIHETYPQLSTEAIQEAIQYSANAVKNEILITSKITA